VGDALARLRARTAAGDRLIVGLSKLSIDICEIRLGLRIEADAWRPIR
jgi:hypothetical protein